MGRDQDGLRRWFPTCKESIFSGSNEDAHGNEWGQLCGKDTEEDNSFFLGKGNFQKKRKKERKRKGERAAVDADIFFSSPDWERFFF